jgi:hypothetical protein
MKKHNNTPKRKRLNREQRISIANNWFKTYNGKNVIKGYSNWFGVDLLCAIAELRIIGENISLEDEMKVRKSLEDRFHQRKRENEKNGKIEIDSEYINDWGSEFEFIAGYTSNGVPYGIRKGEM